MKNLIVVFLLCNGLFLNAQTFRFDNTRNIHVNGTALKEVIPNKIKLAIHLVERKDGRNQVTLGELEQSMAESISVAQIAKESVFLDKATSLYLQRSKKKKSTVISKKSYIVALTDFDQTEVFIKALQERNINFSIRSKSHSDIENIKLQLKIQAINKAKQKAVALLEPLNSRVGKVLLVNDYGNEFNDFNYYRGYDYSPQNSDADYGFRDTSSNAQSFSKITLRSNVNITFEIID